MRGGAIALSKIIQSTLDGIFGSHIDGLMQERRNSIANALGLRLSCTNPSIWSMQIGKDSHALVFAFSPDMFTYVPENNIMFPSLSSPRYW